MKETKRSTLVLAVVIGVGAAARAQAEPAFGDGGHVAISAERLFGYAYSSATDSMNGVDAPTRTNHGFSVLSNPFGGVALGASFSFPRLAVDGFVAEGVTVGAGLGYFHLNQSREASTASTGPREATLNGLVVAPRLGFAARLSPTVSLWPRAGVSYLRLWSGSSTAGVMGSSTTGNLFAVTIEAPLAMTLAPRAVLLLGPTFERTLSGSTTSDPPPGSTAKSATIDHKETAFGVEASLLLLL
jgi:hypothetical protein